MAFILVFLGLMLICVASFLIKAWYGSDTGVNKGYTVLNISNQDEQLTSWDEGVTDGEVELPDWFESMGTSHEDTSLAKDNNFNKESESHNPIMDEAISIPEV